MLNARTIGVATELGFDAAYLLSLWALVFGLQWRLVPLQAAQRHCARPYVEAFTLLAAGDSAHVGLRLLGLARGGLREGLVGYGALATAITVTLFDLLLVQGHQRQLHRHLRRQPIGREHWGLLPRLLLALPQNHWAAVVPPQPWSLLRNLPLLALTAGTGWLYMGSQGDQQRWQGSICGLLLASALCHLPVALWIQEQPLLGLLMIPKSLCYLAMGLIAYRRLPSMAPISSP